jgi:hypothetical protein
MQRMEKVVKDKEGKLSIKPKFYNRGCYFYWIPKKFLGKVIEGNEYLFKFGIPHCYNKRDKKGRPIYICAAIPIFYKIEVKE